MFIYVLIKLTVFTLVAFICMQVGRLYYAREEMLRLYETRLATNNRTMTSLLERQEAIRRLEIVVV